MDYQRMMAQVSLAVHVDPNRPLILPHGTRQSVMDRIDEEYRLLISRVDNHIDRLVALENVLNAELNATTQSESDTEDTYGEDLDSDGDDGVYIDNDILAANQLTTLRQVQFNDDVQEIDSDGTVPWLFTPFGYPSDDGSDCDSDDETIVMSWNDPLSSPDLRFRIHFQSGTDSDTDDDDSL
jgi:hypothetical protein